MVDPSDLLAGGKEAMAKKILEQITPSEHPMADAVATAIVSVEHQQAQAIQRLVEAADLDVEHGHDPERRKEVLLEVGDAVADDRFTEWFLEETVDDLQAAESAAKYAGLEADEFQEVKEKWYLQYDESGVLEGLEDLELDDVADRHTREIFNVDLDTFEERVVEYSRAEAAQHVLAGPVLHHNQIILQTADALESQQERLQELESKIAELEE